MRPSWTSSSRQRSSLGTTEAGADAAGALPAALRAAVVAPSRGLSRWMTSKVPARFHKISQELAKFGAIGLINVGVNFAVVNLLWLTPWFRDGEVKAKAIATIVAATSAYFMNRHWTYRDRPKSSLRREYTLFFTFNLVGLIIELAMVYLAKYGLHRSDRLALNFFTGIGIVLGTIFRFWAYRTHVFKVEPAPAEVTPPLPASATISAPARATTGAYARTVGSRASVAPTRVTAGATGFAGVKPARATPARATATRAKIVPAKVRPAKIASREAADTEANANR